MELEMEWEMDKRKKSIIIFAFQMTNHNDN